MRVLSLTLQLFGPDAPVTGTTPPAVLEFDTEVGAVEWDTESGAAVADTTP